MEAPTQPPHKRLKTSSSSGSTSTPAISRSTSEREAALTRRQIQPAALPTRNRLLLPAAPKPKIQLASPIKQTAKASELPSIKRLCGVPLCKRYPCTLATHRRYAKILRHTKSGSEDRADASANAVSPDCAHHSPPLVVATLSQAGGFPDLPLDGLDQEYPKLRKLFYDFFDTVLHKLHVILVPPGPKSRSWKKQRQKQLFDTAIGSSVSCINLIGTAHNYIANTSSMDEIGQTAGVVIQSKLMKLLRDMLNDYKPQLHAQDVLSIIFTVAIADLAAGRSERLLLHRQALIRVVNSCGGIHNVPQA